MVSRFRVWCVPVCGGYDRDRAGTAVPVPYKHRVARRGVTHPQVLQVVEEPLEPLVVLTRVAVDHVVVLTPGDPVRLCGMPAGLVQGVAVAYVDDLP